MLFAMSPATIDRRLAGPKGPGRVPGPRPTPSPGPCSSPRSPSAPGRSGTRTVPGFVEIDLVGHEGGNSFGEFCFTLTVTDVATGWTVNRSVKNKAAIWVIEAIDHVVAGSPSPSSASTRTTASEFINAHLLRVLHEPGRSPSPGRGRATRTTAATSSRRTGPTSASWSATCASTPTPSSRSSTGSGSSTAATPTSSSPSRSWSAATGRGQGHQAPRQGPDPLRARWWPPACSPRPRRAALTRARNALHPVTLQREIAGLSRRARAAVALQDRPRPRRVNRAFKGRD